CLARVGVALLASLALWAAPVAAQDVTAEVRTWDGQSWRIAQPSLEMFYTIPPASKGANPSDPYTAGPSGNTAGGSPATAMGSGLSMSGSIGQLQSYFDDGSGPRQGRRQADYITVRRGGVERQIPFSSIASVTFARHPVPSTLPAYYVNRHFR